MGVPSSSAGKESACNAGYPSSIPGSGRCPGEGIGYSFQYSWASLVDQLVKHPPAIQEIWVRSLGWEDPLQKGMAIQLQYSCLENSMDRGAWQATDHGVAKSQTRVSDFHFHFCMKCSLGISNFLEEKIQVFPISSLSLLLFSSISLH